MPMSRPLAYVLADIHLRETRSRAHERWQETFFLDVLEQVSRIEGAEYPFPVLILGDLTSVKNRHHSSFVNWMVDGFKVWKDSNRITPYILWGNHDMDMGAWVGAGEKDFQKAPFFSFLMTVGLARPIQEFVLSHEGFSVYTPSVVPADRKEMVFFHGSVRGARLSGSRSLDSGGVVVNDLASYAPLALGGDIHLPQTMDFRPHCIVTYVGSYGFTEALSLKDFLESPGLALGRYGMLLSRDDEGVLEGKRYPNPRLGLTLSMGLSVSRDGVLSVSGLEGSPEEVLERLKETLSQARSLGISYEIVEVRCLDRIESLIEGPARGKSVNKLKKHAAAEASVRDFGQAFVDVWNDVLPPKELVFEHNTVYAESRVFRDEALGRMFSMTEQERLEMLEKALSSVLGEGTSNPSLVHKISEVTRKKYLEYAAQSMGSKDAHGGSK
jgi:hypothetical protein